MRQSKHRRLRRRTTIIIATTALTLAVILAILLVLSTGGHQSAPAPTTSPTTSQASPPSMTDATPYKGDVVCPVQASVKNRYAGCLYNESQGIRLTVNLDGTATLLGGMAVCGIPYSLGNYPSDCSQTVKITFNGPFMGDSINGTITATSTTSSTPPLGQVGSSVTLAITKESGRFRLDIDNIGGISVCSAKNELQLGECGGGTS